MRLKRRILTRLKEKEGLKIFLKASATSQMGAWVDFVVSFVLFEFTPLGPLYSKAIGATAGGVFNCCLNYQWTFRHIKVSKRAVAIKYAAVWVGSMLLNSYGTDLLHWTFMHWTWLLNHGFGEAGCFMAAQLLVSGVVSIFWNILLQRYFVFRNVDIKGFFFRSKRRRKTTDK